MILCGLCETLDSLISLRIFQFPFLFPKILFCQWLFQRFFHALSVLIQSEPFWLYYWLLLSHKAVQKGEWVGIVTVSNIKRWNIDIGFFRPSPCSLESWGLRRDQKRIWKKNFTRDIHMTLVLHQPKILIEDAQWKLILKMWSSRVCIVMFISFLARIRIWFLCKCLRWKSSKSEFNDNWSREIKDLDFDFQV